MMPPAKAAHAQALTCPGCAALERRIAALEAAVTSGAPKSDDAVFLAAIAALGATFGARELANHAVVDGELRAALGGMTSPKRIGRRLHRLADRDIGGYRLTRVDRDAAGVVWFVEAV